jgi:hypothetical protein
VVFAVAEQFEAADSGQSIFGIRFNSHSALTPGRIQFRTHLARRGLGIGQGKWLVGRIK